MTWFIKFKEGLLKTKKNRYKNFMNIYFLLTLSSSIIGPLCYELISERFHLAKFFDGMVIAILIGLISLHILPESFQHTGATTFLAVTFGLLGPVFLSRLLKKNQCEIQKPFLFISILGFIAHNMLDGAALVIHPHSNKSSHLLALAIVVHRLLENMAIWRTLSKNLNFWLSSASICGLSLAMALGYFAGEAIFLRLDANFFHILQSLACGLLFHVLIHPHHIKEMLKTHSPKQLVIKTQSVGAFFGLILAILAYMFWPSHIHSATNEHKADIHEHKSK